MKNLWNYYRDEANDDANKNNGDGYRTNNEKTITSKSFQCKTKLIGNTSAVNSRLGAEGVVPLKYLSNLWRSLDLPLVNCEIELYLPWS